LLLFCSFFFSSRRRHTRWPRDWSSDVCSSDLVLWGDEVTVALFGAPYAAAGPVLRVLAGDLAITTVDAVLILALIAVGRERAYRSEERRVGKEGRSRWWRYR